MALLVLGIKALWISFDPLVENKLGQMRLPQNVGQLLRDKASEISEGRNLFVLEYKPQNGNYCSAILKISS
jgi:hypothetical protein